MLPDHKSSRVRIGAIENAVFVDMVFCRNQPIGVIIENEIPGDGGQHECRCDLSEGDELEPVLSPVLVSILWIER